ncbi:Hypothetical predicted protein [Podarcis lilfordi]|uniref:Uncharacterized protein n=1 Tax=Podarcis lilfordi TaxID=74358 RepID=A0AA35JVV4_9SAUR|nr:Hypothetical predicted protein [Podarcis lilfordi]
MIEECQANKAGSSTSCISSRSPAYLLQFALVFCFCIDFLNYVSRNHFSNS